MANEIHVFDVDSIEVKDRSVCGLGWVRTIEVFERSGKKSIEFNLYGDHLDNLKMVADQEHPPTGDDDTEDLPTHDIGEPIGASK